ncbi:acyl-CoA dehydrogenase family protein [Eremococcus coleocola]|uniref:Acyl-CoA dehydrogenase, C-terminal domain protein n=1 Tax=Eremococcus coleocola ACS-139-V-Col8 TaxID=908337 RepID=E4KQQ1_9LACT|nr:acyl-CoA dehydrogenase family protein [Eremococcus coleocola]EFR30770.1 acyl-CoA dehydrogenase, C-terminal domain protein [Eremococcus coleocola ACS-139-V-Col8]
MSKSKIEKLQYLYPEDIYGYSHDLSENEVDFLLKLRETLEKELYPVIDDHWKKELFPMEAFKKITDLGIMTDPSLFEGRENKLKTSEIFNLFRLYELNRMDSSIGAFTIVHGGLAYSTVLIGGSQEQIDYYAPKLASYEWHSCFGLTEPLHGSDIAGGLATTAELQGDKWVINGEKKWIGGAATADVLPIFARDVADGQIKCFMVPGGTPGLTVDKIDGKISLRLIQNGHIKMNNVQVDKTARLENINSFRDVAKILYTTRADVAHLATGLHAGALANTLKYVKEREQFGKKISQFQLVQEKLARMQANCVTSLALSHRLAQLQEQGRYEEVQSSLAKMNNAYRLRETVALGRELLGGNGIIVEHDVARFFVDAEAAYSYEGTHEVNSLILGRFLTGKGAFV